MSAAKRVRALVEGDLKWIRSGNYRGDGVDGTRAEIERLEESLANHRKHLEELLDQEKELLQWLIDNPE